MEATSHVWLFKLNRTENSVSQPHCPWLHSHTWLVAAMLGSTDTERHHHRRKFCRNYLRGFPTGFLKKSYSGSNFKFLSALQFPPIATNLWGRKYPTGIMSTLMALGKLDVQGQQEEARTAPHSPLCGCLGRRIHRGGDGAQELWWGLLAESTRPRSTG